MKDISNPSKHPQTTDKMITKWCLQVKPVFAVRDRVQNRESFDVQSGVVEI